MYGHVDGCNGWIYIYIHMYTYHHEHHLNNTPHTSPKTGGRRPLARDAGGDAPRVQHRAGRHIVHHLHPGLRAGAWPFFKVFVLLLFFWWGGCVNACAPLERLSFLLYTHITNNTKIGLGGGAQAPEGVGTGPRGGNGLAAVHGARFM